MIVIDAAKNRCLAIDVSQASLKAKLAAQSCLTARYSPSKKVYQIGVEDFARFDTLLQELEAPDDGEMTEAGERAYKTFCDERDRLLALKTQEPDWSLLNRIQGWKTKPYVDQLQCIQFHTTRGRSLEASETGVGKTLVLLYTFLYWRSMGFTEKGLILCVNSGKLDWEKEVYQHTDASVMVVGNGSKVVRDDILRFSKSSANLLIVHYDAIIPSNKKKVDVLKPLADIPFGFIALDEVHTLKNPETVRHRAVMSLLDGWPEAKVVCATGTAIDGSPKSAWVPLKIASGGSYVPSYSQFIRHFITWEQKYIGKLHRKIWLETGFKNLGQLKERLEPVSIRFLKSQVLDRPSKIFKTRLVRMTGAQEKIYNEIKSQVIASLTEEGNEDMSLTAAATKMLRLRQVAHHPLLLDGVVHFTGDSAKYMELDEIAEEILSNPDAQMLVWTQWRAGVEKLVERYKQYGAIAFYGGSNDRVIRDTVLSKKARMIVAIPEKAGTSIDWLKVCRTAVYLEKPWNLALYRQSLDRIDRRSNTDAALIITIQALGSVDLVVEAALQKKQDVFDALTVDDAYLVTLGKQELLQYLKM